MKRLPFLALLVLPELLIGQVVDSAFRFTSGDLTLEGTLLVPADSGPFPAVVIIAGSGPTDRDGNAGPTLRTDMYRQLAEGLAARGIASLRYDKRGLPSTEGTFDLATTTIADFAADAHEAVRALDRRPEVGPIFLLGHSEGGTHAILAAGDGAPVRGLVLVATVGRRMSVVLREQLARQLPESVLVRFDTAWARYIETDEPVTVPPMLAALFAPVNRTFLQSWAPLDNAGLVAGLEHPVLVVQGETDVQVTTEDARLLAAARPDVTLAILPGVNHVLKHAEGATAMAQMASYADPGIPIAPEVVATVAGWILQQAVSGAR